MSKNEIVVVDTEAGLEHFGRGLESSIDTIVILVDPSSESVDYAEKAYSLAKDIGIKNIWVVINKVNSETIANRLTEKLKNINIPVSGHIKYNEVIFEAELEGDPIYAGTSSKELNNLVNLMLEKMPKG